MIKDTKKSWIVGYSDSVFIKDLQLSLSKIHSKQSLYSNGTVCLEFIFLQTKPKVVTIQMKVHDRYLLMTLSSRSLLGFFHSESLQH